jgi:predicted peptidase
VLHSRGEQGSDNERQLNLKFVTAWAEHMEDPTLILAPMAPQGTSAWSVESLSGLIDAVAESHAVDENRLYINGHSFGGEGTLRTLRGSTHGFAAAAVFAPAVRDTSQLDLTAMAATSQWDFVSESDTVVDNDTVKGLYDELEAAQWRGVHGTRLVSVMTPGRQAA